MNRFQEFDEGDFTDKTVLDQLNASFLPKCLQEVARYLNWYHSNECKAINGSSFSWKTLTNRMKSWKLSLSRSCDDLFKYTQTQQTIPPPVQALPKNNIKKKNSSVNMEDTIEIRM